MSGIAESQNHAYSWHQSHDQATVLLLVPYETQEEDLEVVIERNSLVAGVRGRAPVVKGCLYGNVDTNTSVWQLEPRTSHISSRLRTISTTSTGSNQSSYAYISEPDISSSFAASLDESNPTSDSEEHGFTSIIDSPGLSSPVSSADERTGFATIYRRRNRPLGTSPSRASRAVSPRFVAGSLASSSISSESLHGSKSGRLLTLHLEKADPVIWPSLIVGPISETLSQSLSSSSGFDARDTKERAYDMDPTSLVLLGSDLLDIRQDSEEAFECFLRAWHQARVPSATMRLATHYVPPHLPLDGSSSPQPERGTPSYYAYRLGGPLSLAQLYLEAGLLHIEGAASVLLSSSSFSHSLSSIRIQQSTYHDQQEPMADAWRQDRESAKRYFQRAKLLCPSLDVPMLPADQSNGEEGEETQLVMPSIELHPNEEKEEVARGRKDASHVDEAAAHSARSKTRTLNHKDADGLDGAWYLYVPGLVGAGTALLVVGVIGALSVSSWRKSQG